MSSAGSGRSAALANRLARATIRPRINTEICSNSVLVMSLEHLRHDISMSVSCNVYIQVAETDGKLMLSDKK